MWSIQRWCIVDEMRVFVRVERLSVPLTPRIMWFGLFGWQGGEVCGLLWEIIFPTLFLRRCTGRKCALVFLCSCRRSILLLGCRVCSV